MFPETWCAPWVTGGAYRAELSQGARHFFDKQSAEVLRHRGVHVDGNNFRRVLHHVADRRHQLALERFEGDLERRPQLRDGQHAVRREFVELAGQPQHPFAFVANLLDVGWDARQEVDHLNEVSPQVPGAGVGGQFLVADATFGRRTARRGRPVRRAIAVQCRQRVRQVKHVPPVVVARRCSGRVIAVEVDFPFHQVVHFGDGRVPFLRVLVPRRPCFLAVQHAHKCFLRGFFVMYLAG